MNCPNCGAVIKEGKFCNYCGAKLPDDTKRVEVNISKRIEDAAEMKRADYEADESRLRQREERARLNARKTKRVSSLIILAICIVCFGISFLFKTGSAAMLICMMTGIWVGLPLFIWILFQLVTGKW